MPCRIVLLALILLFTGSRGSVWSEETELGDGGVVVRFEEPLRAAAKEVIESCPAVRADLVKVLGPMREFSPVIRLVKDRENFRRIADSDLIVAFAVPRQDLIVIDYSRMNIHPFTLDVTLKHELCHLQLHQRVREGNLPRWLDEGICQWVTGGIAEIMTDGSRSVLKEAVLSKQLIPLSELSVRFPHEDRALQLAYEESRSVVEYVNGEFGSAGVRNIVGHLGAGESLEEAIEKSLSISLGELETRWRASLAKGTSWFAYTSNYLYEVLFLFGAVITVFGFLRFLKRKRDYRDKDGEDEGGKDFRL